ncbi:uncharacterized protein [Rhodnius prolixus]|uniref:uncharacterized protein n=1 Tax=Rhodnius prolixus TaxID=13249 RepID=UPI003D18D4FF
MPVSTKEPSMEELIAMMKEIKEDHRKWKDEMIEDMRNWRNEMKTGHDGIKGEIKREVNDIPEGMKAGPNKGQEAKNIQEEHEGSKDDADSRSDLEGDQFKGGRSHVEVQKAAWEEERIENCSEKEDKDQGKRTIVQAGVEWSPEATREGPLLGEDTGSVLKCQGEPVRKELAPSSRDVQSYCAQRNSLAIEVDIFRM